jgi:hypothetical protein
MLGLSTLLSPVVTGITNYFTNRQNIKAKEQEREDAVADAKVQAKIALLSNEQTHDINLDLISVKERGWKDDIITYVLLSPVIILMFNPVCALWFGYDPEVINIAMQDGFKALEDMPEYMYVGLGIVFADIFGLRSMVKNFTSSTFTKKK